MACQEDTLRGTVANFWNRVERMGGARLGRGSIETAHVLKQLSLASVRIFAYLDYRAVVVDNIMDKMPFTFTALMDENEPYRAQQRAVDPLYEKRCSTMWPAAEGTAMTTS